MSAPFRDDLSMGSSEKGLASLNFNLLIDELESGSSGSCANVIRKLREHEVAAYHAGVGGPTGELVGSFIASLDLRAAERNSEIEKTCSYNYQSFVNSTRELLGIEQNAAKLQNKLGSLNDELEKALSKFMNSCNEFSRCKITLEHVDQCIEALQNSLPVLEQYSRVEQSIAEGRFYHALKTLEDLEHSQLDRIRLYAFSEIIVHRIPKTRASIKNASLAELTDFLESIRKKSIMLGALAMKEAASASGMDSEALLEPDPVSGQPIKKQSVFVSSDLSKVKLADASSLAKQFINSANFPLEGLDSELETLANAAVGSPVSKGTSENSPKSNNADGSIKKTADLVDFGPVYRCLHIHSVLNERTEFERHYCAQRRKQCQLLLSLSPTQQANMRNYAEFFSSICGFFVVDDYLRHTLPGSSALYQAYLDELWGSTVDRLVEFARSNAVACTSTHDLIRLKNHSLIFERTMQNLGFPTPGLADMITWIQKRYHRILSNKWRDNFENILIEDNFNPIRLENDEDQENLAKLYPQCLTAEFRRLPYPRQLCFSWMIPKIHKAVCDFIDLCCRFCDNMNLAYTELEDTVNRATNGLITDGLNVAITTNIRKSARNLPRLIQFCINLDELETVCGHLDNYLQASVLTDTEGLDANRLRDELNNYRFESMESGTTGANPPRSRLHGASLLKDIRALVEGLVYTHLNESVEEFINVEDYYEQLEDHLGSDVTDKQTNGFSNNTTLQKPKPSDNIMNLTSWLRSTFSTFANLPPKLAQTACISVCKHVARLFYDVLLGPEANSFSETHINQLSVDLFQCEQFARSEPVPGLDSQKLWLVFADLRQLLDLFLKDDWNTYIVSRQKNDGTLYDRVPPSVAIKLLERVLDAEKKRTGFLQAMRKEKRGRRNKIEEVIKQLRQLDVASRPI